MCSTQEYWIILSAKRDKYLCVTHADLTSISNRLYGWRNQGGAVEQLPQFGVEADKLIASLMSHGIITSSASDGKPFAESECPVRESAIKIPEPITSTNRSLLCAAHCLVACAKIDWQLRMRDLSQVLARIERRRLRIRSSAAIHDVTHASRLLAAFKDLRPLYPRPYLCLFDSLALLEFLASYRIFPRFVFGVIADPFQAHCWLQEGSVVVNDDLERVGRYKPILSL